MNPTQIPEYMDNWYPQMRRLRVGKPGWSGNEADSGDGSSVSNAATLDAMVGFHNGHHCFREVWKLDDDDLQIIERASGLIELTLWVPQMPVHAMRVVSKEKIGD